MSLVDANVVLRYLLDDHAELSAKATEIIEQQAVTLPMEATLSARGWRVAEIIDGAPVWHG